MAFLKNQESWQLHAPVHKQAVVMPIVTSERDARWQADLVDFQSLSQKNGGFSWILTVIDTFTKYAWAEPMKDKTAKSVVSVMKNILQRAWKDFKSKPRLIHSDNGMEFTSTCG